MIIGMCKATKKNMEQIKKEGISSYLQEQDELNTLAYEEPCPIDDLWDMYERLD